MIRDSHGNLHGRTGRFERQKRPEAGLSLSAASKGDPLEEYAESVHRAGVAVSMRPGAGPRALHDADPFVRMAASSAWDVTDEQAGAVRKDPQVAEIFEAISA